MSHQAKPKILIVGGGAAGFFAAIVCAERSRDAHVTLLEATHEPLDKVRISGGGRCNVTHHCFDPAVLVGGYPRGHRELLGPFHRFQPRDTVDWFKRRGVLLKAEADGRMFPTTDQSSTIIDCLMHAAEKAGVIVRDGCRVTEVARQTDRQSGESFRVCLHDGLELLADRILLATGNSTHGHQLAASLGHSIVPCVPSLFTFKVPDQRLSGLSGISSADVSLQLLAGGERFSQRGAILITHWGLSGPAILKLSAWGARALAECRYQAELSVNWLPALSNDELLKRLSELKIEFARRSIATAGLEPVPRRLWASLVTSCGIADDLTWANLAREQFDLLALELAGGKFRVAGKGIFKEEFVTCGGVSLKEVDFRTMQSRICPELYVAGEILDIDGITGGYNFQSAWTTGFIAGESMAGTK